MYLCLFLDFLFYFCTIDFLEYELILHWLFFVFYFYYGKQKVYSKLYSILITVTL